MLEINKFDRIIAANWKLNGSLHFLKDYFKNFESFDLDSRVCAIICPPATYLEKCNSQKSQFFIGAQNCSSYDTGSYTGEISALMLRENNCQFCLVGHSERRQIFRETNEDTKIKADQPIDQNIIPIICIGETLEEKKIGITKDVSKEQIDKCLPNKASFNSVIIAYEPIWAIGSGLVPTLDEINDIHNFLKKDLKNYKIIYGGSVKSENAKGILNLNDVDGVLVGGASLNFLEFQKILQTQ